MIRIKFNMKKYRKT